MSSPLFDIYDPLGGDDLGVIPFGRKKRTLADLMPEEEKTSMLRALSQRGISGLSGLGWVIDTPGGIVRTLLAGKSLGDAFTDERVSGRDLLRKWGMAGRKDDWGNFATGMAAELLLDPTTYIGVGLIGRGAKTIAGGIAGKAGLLAGDIGLLARQQGMGKARFLRNSTPDDLIRLSPNPIQAGIDWSNAAGTRAKELLNQPLTRTNRVSIPGFQTGAYDLFGRRIGDALADASDAIGDYAKTAPLIGSAVRGTSALLDYKFKGLTDYNQQWMGRELSEAERVAALAADGPLARAQVNVARSIGPDMFQSQEFADAFRMLAEDQADQIPAHMAAVMQTPAVQALYRYWRFQQRKALTTSRDLGIPLQHLSPGPNNVRFFPRQSVLLKEQTPILNASGGPMYPPSASPPYLRSARLAPVGDGAEYARRDWARAFPAWVLNAMQQDATLQAALRQAPNALPGGGSGVRPLLDNWITANAPDFWMPTGISSRGGSVFDYADDATQELLYRQTADHFRRADPQFAKNALPLFGNSLNDLARYERGRRRAEATANVLLNQLNQTHIAASADSIPGNTAYSAADALRRLGFDSETGPAALARRMGISPDDLANVSFDRNFIENYAQRIERSRQPMETKGLLKAADSYTRAFKTLALLWPARYTRDRYSGGFAAATQGLYNPIDRATGVRVRSGDYSWLPARLKDAPGYTLLSDEEKIRKFLADSGGQALSNASVTDNLLKATENLAYKEIFPGAARPTWSSLLSSTRDWARNPRKWLSLSENPLVELGDRAAETSDAANRIGTYLTAIRKGYAPSAAKSVTDLTQVNYQPQKYSEFEREFLARLFPFYKYTRGIAPLVVQETLERPAGLQSASVRAINRGTEPSEDQFVPEYLRQSAALPMPGSIPFLGVKTPGVTRFLTNLDLPHESFVNLVTPGIGNTVAEAVKDSLTKTGQNILGQTNPLLKGPLEYITNRQFYSGRQLSDLYSVLEQTFGMPGRLAEQALVNAPGGSRILGTYRQLTDQRISPQERAAKFLVNSLTGVKLQDVDQEKTMRLAARTTLNQLLDNTPGIGSYQNLFVSPEDLAKLPDTQKRQYLLYRILQSEAAKRARQKKKDSMDPLSILGVR